MTSQIHTGSPTGIETAPVADWVTIPELYADPFPIYDRLVSRTLQTDTQLLTISKVSHI